MNDEVFSSWRSYFPFTMLPMDEAVTLLLKNWRAGDDQALNQLMPLVYDQLRGLAKHYMRGERQDHTLRATAVVHEAYLKLAQSDLSFSDRVHFYAVAATVMRHILLDWAKSNRRAKRGGGAVKIELEEGSAVTWEDPDTIIEIDRLLERLSVFDTRKAKIAEMIFFSGMTYEETASFLGISTVTVHRELKMAKAWMFNELTPQKRSTPE